MKRDKLGRKNERKKEWKLRRTQEEGKGRRRKTSRGWSEEEGKDEEAMQGGKEASNRGARRKRKGVSTTT